MSRMCYTDCSIDAKIRVNGATNEITADMAIVVQSRFAYFGHEHLLTVVSRNKKNYE